MNKRKQTRNPYGKTAKRKAALAWMAAHNITQPRALYPMVRVDVPAQLFRPAHKLVTVRNARLIS